MLQSKIPSAKDELPPSESLANGAPKSSHTLWAIANAIDKAPKYHCEVILLKIPLIHIIEHGEIKLVHSEKLHN